MKLRISGNAVSGGWSADVPVDIAAKSTGVAALWARSRITALTDIERRGNDPDGVREQIVETALKHHLVSKYTSLVAVDKTPARPVGDPLSSKNVPNLMPYGQSANAIYALPATATSGPALRLTGALLLLSAFFLLMLRPELISAGMRCRA